jgi:LuxR family maltose regulon positive regulatory protein
MTDKLIQTRIIPPGLTDSIVRRKRLIKLLGENIEKSLILLCSSAGYGKTTLVRDFLSSCGIDYAWYYATPDINSYFSFFNYIIHSLKKIEDKFGANTLELIDALRKDAQISKKFKNDINDIGATFINEFCSCFKDKVIFVIDDLHNINSENNGQWLNYLFDELFDNLPQNLHLIITTRDIPDFNLGKLKAKRRLLLIGNRELEFDKDEIHELLDHTYSIAYTQEDIQLLTTKLSGWITGIHLIIQTYGQKFGNIKLSDKLNYEEIFNYFANEIFENLDERIKEFLIATALLDDFDYNICNYLLGTDDSEAVIHKLLDKNIFIQRSIASPDVKAGEISRVIYNYQELFKIFLLSKLKVLKTKSESKAQLNKIFQYYLKHDDVFSAVSYGLEAKDYGAVIPIIKEKFNHLFEKGNFEILWKWTSSILPELTNKDRYLLYYIGLLYLYLHSEPQKSIEFLDRAHQLAGDCKDTQLLIDCLIAKTDASLLVGKFEEQKSELNNLLKLDISRPDRARVLYTISQLYYREGHLKYEKIIELLTEAITICNEDNILSLKADITRMLGNVYHDWGDSIKAIHYFEQALSIDTDVYKKFRAMVNIIYDYSSAGLYSKAKEYLSQTEELYNKYPSLFIKRFLLRCKATFHFELGDFEESIKNYTVLNELEFKNNIKHYIVFSYVNIGEAYYYLRKYDLAMKNFEIAKDYNENNYEYHNILIQYLKTKLSVRIKPAAENESILLKTLEFHETNNILLQKIQIEFHLADYYLSSGMFDSAAKYLSDCLKLSSEKQYFSFLEQEILNSRHLFDFAISRPELAEFKKFIRTLFENVRGRLELNWISDNYRKRLAGEIHNTYDLSITAFGKLEFKLRGETIPETQWVRKKSKLILAYLLAEQNRLLTKDKMIDEFFQDIPPENVDAVFHNTLSNMRTALKVKYDFPNEADSKTRKDKESSFKWSPALLIYEDKTLRWNPDFYYSSDCIKFDKLYNSAFSANTNTDDKITFCMQASKLYQGEFLPGYYESWCEEKRQNYSNMFIKLCFELISLQRKKKSFAEIVKYADRILKFDKLNEEAYISLIEAYSEMGEINTAKDTFSLMLKNFDEELGEKPDKSTLDRINKIL